MRPGRGTDFTSPAHAKAPLPGDRRVGRAHYPPTGPPVTGSRSPASSLSMWFAALTTPQGRTAVMPGVEGVVSAVRRCQDDTDADHEPHRWMARARHRRWALHSTLCRRQLMIDGHAARWASSSNRGPGTARNARDLKITLMDACFAHPVFWPRRVAGALQGSPESIKGRFLLGGLSKVAGLLHTHFFQTGVVQW